MSGVNILNGRLVLPGQAEPQSGHIHIIGERIAEVGRAEPIAETIDAENLVVAPGIIDLGVFATDKPDRKSVV